MKKTQLFLLMWLCSCSMLLKAQLPIWLTNYAIPNLHYKPNVGQVHLDNGSLCPQVQYNTDIATGAIYIQDQGKVSYLTINTNTLWKCRVDVRAICTQNAEQYCGSLVPMAITGEITNYYDATLVNGVTDVANYKGVAHTGAFPNINIIYTSDPTGIMTAYEIKPGGNASNIRLKFSGQSTLAISGGNIIAGTGYSNFTFNALTAYQYDNATNTVIPLGWSPSWQITGDEATLSGIGAYNTANPLYLVDKPFGPQPPPMSIAGVGWSTCYGTGPSPNVPNPVFKDEEGGTIRVDKNTGDIYHTMVRGEKGNFIADAGCEQAAGAGGKDIFLSKFNGTTYERKWSTYFGGAGDDKCAKTALSYDAASPYFYLTGSTTGTLPVPTLGGNQGLFKQTTNHGGTDAFILSVSKSQGVRQWMTLFGGSGSEEGRSITIDDIDHKLYIVGKVTYSPGALPTGSSSCGSSVGTGFPFCNSGSKYSQNTFRGTGFTTSDCFVAEFDIDGNNNGLTWSTLFGGDQDEDGIDVLKVNNSTEKAVYICGYTKSTYSGSSFPPDVIAPTTPGFFPLANPVTATDYFQYDNLTANDEEAFIAKFNGNYQLHWSTHFGGAGDERFTALATNKSDETVYAVGLTTTVNQAGTGNNMAVNDVWWPAYKAGITGMFHQAQLARAYDPLIKDIDVMITRFSAGGELRYSTYFGGNEMEYYEYAGLDDLMVYARMDDVNNLYIFGTNTIRRSTSPKIYTPVNSVAGYYFQGTNAGDNPGEGSPKNSDAFLAAFNTMNVFAYGTFFGGWSLSSGFNVNGQADEVARDFDLAGHYAVYLTGGSACNGTPEVKPPSPGYFQPFGGSAGMINGDRNIFISRIGVSDWWASTGIKDPPHPMIGQLPKERESVNAIASPNPLTGDVSTITVTMDLETATDATITIFDVTGKQFYSGTHALVKGNNQLPLDVSSGHMAVGSYFVRISGVNLDKTIILLVK